MKTKEELKQELKNSVIFETVNPPITGGQTCGIMPSKQRLYCEDLDITIELGYYRNSWKNRDLLMTLFDLALDELVK